MPKCEYMTRAQVTIECHPREVALITAIASLIRSSLGEIDDRTITDGIAAIFLATDTLNNHELCSSLNDEQRRLVGKIWEWADKYRQVQYQGYVWSNFQKPTDD